jgi:hypothetical protein
LSPGFVVSVGDDVGGNFVDSEHQAIGALLGRTCFRGGAFDEFADGRQRIELPGNRDRVK